MMCAEDCHMRKTLFGAVFTLLLAAVGLAAGSGLGTKVRVLVALATSYIKKGRTLISLDSWSLGLATARLNIDWKALGLDPAKAVLRAPAIPDIQFATTFAPGDPIPF
jgi:Family of unknown function (DUF6067)